MTYSIFQGRRRANNFDQGHGGGELPKLHIGDTRTQALQLLWDSPQLKNNGESPESLEADRNPSVVVLLGQEAE